MDLSDDEDFYDSDQSDVGNKSLHAMLKQNLYRPDNDLEEFERQIVGEEEALNNVQEEILGEVTENGTLEEVVLGPVNSVNEDEKDKNLVNSDSLIVKKLDEAEELVVAPEVLVELENKRFLDALDNDTFEPLKKKQKVIHGEDENPHKTIVMHVPQFIRCSKDGQSIQVR